MTKVWLCVALINLQLPSNALASDYAARELYTSGPHLNPMSNQPKSYL